MGIISRTSEIVPSEFQTNPQGFYITFVVANVDEVFDLAIKQEVEVLEPPHNTFYGQRRLLLKDPNGALVDVSSPIQAI